MSNTTDAELWRYRDDVSSDGSDLIGFDVEATDGHIGAIDEATAAAGRYSIVVDTGHWIFGKKRMIPAGVVQRISQPDRKVFINMTKHDVKEAPEFYGDEPPDVGRPDSFDPYDPYDQYFRPFF